VVYLRSNNSKIKDAPIATAYVCEGSTVTITPVLASSTSTIKSLVGKKAYASFAKTGNIVYDLVGNSATVATWNFTFQLPAGSTLARMSFAFDSEDDDAMMMKREKTDWSAQLSVELHEALGGDDVVTVTDCLYFKDSEGIVSLACDVVIQSDGDNAIFEKLQQLSINPHGGLLLAQLSNVHKRRMDFDGGQKEEEEGEGRSSWQTMIDQENKEIAIGSLIMLNSVLLVMAVAWILIQLQALKTSLLRLQGKGNEMSVV